MARRRRTILQLFNEINEDKCIMCRRSVNDEKDVILLGPIEEKMFFNKNRQIFRIHYYCMLFAACLSQNGNEDEGIKGFLLDDIKKEVARGASMSCSFCRLKGATMGCEIKNCRKVYHLPCALENDVRVDFRNFASLCSGHRPAPADHELNIDKDPLCSVCLVEIVKGSSVSDRIVCGTCKHPFHVNCIRQTALKFGIHHFRCPYCRESNQFIDICKAQGVYIPNQDAEWENGNAFADHYEDNRKCTLPLCLNPRKIRKAIEDHPLWDVVCCEACGSNGVHLKCGALTAELDSDFICWDCCVGPKKGESASVFFFKRTMLFKYHENQIISLKQSADSEMDEIIDVEDVDDNIERSIVSEAATTDKRCHDLNNNNNDNAHDTDNDDGNNAAFLTDSETEEIIFDSDETDDYSEEHSAEKVKDEIRAFNAQKNEEEIQQSDAEKKMDHDDAADDQIERKSFHGGRKIKEIYCDEKEGAIYILTGSDESRDVKVD